ncbi:Fe2+-dependent dioxygenase [Magnetospira sp. QH-2]|uniref:Fe2+-dependent dioxygenase n=1 Tax=Magnetospira sp. (strain QH-2) TaxID=1288970 RepID=UPI0003E80B5D|nr:Fe2+-dependent dioxygenase [Magnetospira sp. QH-2]CCQ74362.1 putative PKHD-type hydroxylase [Magnetospira sp. QH-2]
MRLHIKGLLSPQELNHIDSILMNGTFVDGGATADTGARAVKSNLELDAKESEGADEAAALVYTKLATDSQISDNALPLRFSRPIFSRYEPGMSYGRHVDNPLLGDSGMRTDISCTVFLSDPDDYDGGELALLNDDGSESMIKLARGDAYVYPTGTPHRVNEVTRGARVAAIVFMQSVVADPHRRKILSTFHRVHHSMVEKYPDADETAEFNEAYYYLFRLWAQV